jgi:hypothetical protein
VIRKIDEIEYMNTGDWIDSCSALLEHQDGSFELVRWTSIQAIADSEAHAEVSLRSAA